MEPSSSSKVTVEYFDPSNVFPLISSGLLARLPLRNLHWKSPVRPLRSISSLHVDLRPHGRPPLERGSSASGHDELAQGRRNDSPEGLSRTTSKDEQKTVPDAGLGTFEGPIKERRHQIPGLRQTPYLKIFFLRCDDNDAYKSSSRKVVREWIKEHTTSTQNTPSTNPQENHDAYEWLIVHVVLPKTPAALQPALSGSGTGSGNVAERPSSASRWPGRGQASLLEKLRSDFNGSSKTSRDRVAQIRLSQTDIPPHLAPADIPSVVTPYQESPQDQEAAWSDLISKLKSLILTSFDARVRQYEEDLREKDMQRALPGWNFCTFFVLKEGLARGFESVGLVEDALIGYDELAAGLESVIPDQALVADGGMFLRYTEDLRRQAELARLVPEHEEKRLAELSEHRSENVAESLNNYEPQPLNVNKKRYRDLILSNNISVFDFRCYVFARQMSLLLRLGNAWSSKAGLSAKQHARPGIPQMEASAKDMTGGSNFAEDTEDLNLLAEVCDRAAEFVTTNARTMRADLHNAFDLKKELRSRAERSTDDEHNNSEQQEKLDGVGQVSDNIVSSWTFAVCQQILAETSTASLPISLSKFEEANPSGEKMGGYGGSSQEQKVSISEPKTMLHPTRHSSLPLRSQTGTDYGKPPSSPGFFSQQAHTAAPQSGNFLKPGLEELAASRGALYLLSRNVLEHLGARQQWSIGWGNLHISDFEDVSLDDNEQISETREEQADGQDRAVDVRGVDYYSLRLAMKEKESFYRLYEMLSNRALQHYSVANKDGAKERLMAELGAMKFYLGDHESAASYFKRLAPLYSERGWSSIETSMLELYAKSLKELDRKEDYIEVVLTLLSQSAHQERRNAHLVSSKTSSPTSVYLSDLLSRCKNLSTPITFPLGRLFCDVQVSHYIRHLEENDGFQLQLRFRHLLKDDLTIKRARIKLIEDSTDPGSEVWLESTGEFTLRHGLAEVWLRTNANLSGSFFVDCLSLELEGIAFVHEASSGELSPRTKATSDYVNAFPPTDSPKSHVLCYHRSDAFDATLTLPQTLSLESPKCVEIRVSSGRNHLLEGEIRMRSASAGLRLLTAEARSVDNALEVHDSQKSGIIVFAELRAGAEARIKVPYGIEDDRPEISIKIDVSYRTENGTCRLSKLTNLTVALPLGVSVQDVFKRTALFSRFTISTAGAIPLRLLSYSLEESESFEVYSAGPAADNVLVFPKQPASLTYKIIRRLNDLSSEDGKNKKRSLALNAKYRCLDKEICKAVELAFVSALEESSFLSLSRLLLPHLLSRTLQSISPADLEAIGLIGEHTTLPFDSMNWEIVLQYLPVEERNPVAEWLREWHQQHGSILLPSASDPQTDQRIIIPVNIPEIHIVHTAELKLSRRPRTKEKSGALQMAALGQMVWAELQVEQSRRWAPASWAETKISGEALEFVFEIHADPDIWLIGGQRRVHFSAREKEVQKFPVVLIPLRSGQLLLPSVEIIPARARARTGSSIGRMATHSRQSSQLATGPVSTGGAGKEARQRRSSSGHATRGSSGPMEQSAPVLVCETDYRSQGQTVTVIPNVQSTTVRLEPGDGAEGSAWLLESGSRADEWLA